MASASLACNEMPPPKSPPRKKARGTGGGRQSDLDEPESDASFVSSKPSTAFTDDLQTPRNAELVSFSNEGASIPPWPVGSSTSSANRRATRRRNS